MEGVCKEEIYRAIHDRISGELFRFLYHKFGASNHPEDGVQEAFIKLWKNCKKVSPEKARAFLFTVARNFTLNQIAKASTERKNAHLQVDNEVSNQTPHDVLVENEFELKLKTVLGDLPEKQRVAFMLNKAEGMKHKEIADMLGISQKAVEKRIYTAAKTVMSKLGKKI